MARRAIVMVGIWMLGVLPFIFPEALAETKIQDHLTKSTDPPSHQPVSQNIFTAFNRGDLGYFRALLDHGANPNTRDPKSGCTLLMLADNAAMTQLLLSHGADPNLQDYQGATALHHAVICSNALEIIPHLLAKGADINAKAAGWLQETPFMVAKRHFFQNNPTYGTRVMRLLASKGADINAADESGYTVLISAVVNDKPELVRLMIELGADIHHQANDGLTAVGWAQELGFVDIMELLEAAQSY